MLTLMTPSTIYLALQIFRLLDLLIRILRLFDDLVPIPPLILALARLRILSLPLVLPLIPNFILILTLVRALAFLLPLVLVLLLSLVLVLLLSLVSLQVRTRFTMNPPLFLPPSLPFEIPLLLFSHQSPRVLLQEHSLLRVRHLACRVHLH